ncbi:NADH-quinone oxidoreductase subunit J [Zavarzinia sp.]|uniref:NADH-quinone oxidoreductase subunit J n=1 Tax=Zavarzinia sp. TaxID=2027920 RepID=UPI003BB61D9C|nr:NADH-quinone oxidoreductase subunit J [Zavarzinia sp.]
MTISALVFYLFATITVGSAVMVISSRNPVHSVLFLILAFFNSAGLFLLLGAEFLSMILVIVYVGAVAVLFLFVVMMLDVNFTELRQGFLQYLPVGGLIGLILLVELLLIVGSWTMIPDVGAFAAARAPDIAAVSNTDAIGRIMYTQYLLPFQGAGLILLVAMIGAIVLTLRHRPGVKRQVISAQVSRTMKTAVEVKKVQPGQGI